MEVSRLPADCAATVGLDEVDDPAIVVLEVPQDLGHGLEAYTTTAAAGTYNVSVTNPP
jgi:hypothetical protein